MPTNMTTLNNIKFVPSLVNCRQALFATWKKFLDAAGITLRPDMARTEFLSDPDERVKWTANSLPADDLCTENAIMLNRFNR